MRFSNNWKCVPDSFCKQVLLRHLASVTMEVVFIYIPVSPIIRFRLVSDKLTLIGITNHDECWNRNASECLSVVRTSEGNNDTHSETLRISGENVS